MTPVSRGYGSDDVRPMYKKHDFDKRLIILHQVFVKPFVLGCVFLFNAYSPTFLFFSRLNRHSHLSHKDVNFYYS